MQDNNRKVVTSLKKSFKFHEQSGHHPRIKRVSAFESGKANEGVNDQDFGVGFHNPFAPKVNLFVPFREYLRSIAGMPIVEGAIANSFHLPFAIHFEGNEMEARVVFQCGYIPQLLSKNYGILFTRVESLRR